MRIRAIAALAGLPRPMQAAVVLLSAYGVFVLVSLAHLVWREGGLHWFMWVSQGGFALVSLACAAALTRKARWAWWVALLLWGRRVVIYALAVFGAYRQADHGTAMEHLRSVSSLGVWLLVATIIVGLLLHEQTRAALRASARRR